VACEKKLTNSIPIPTDTDFVLMPDIQICCRIYFRQYIF